MAEDELSELERRRSDIQEILMNAVSLVGRVTKDPMISCTSSQMCVAKFNLAINRQTKGADFPSIVAFGKMAETIEKYVHKGDRLGIVGHIQTSNYESEGRKIYTTDVVVERLEFFNSKTEASPEDVPANEEQISGFEKLTGEDIPFED